MSETVTLEQSWTWRCPACECVNHEPCVIAELTPDEKEEMMVEHQIYGAETGDFVSAPSVVECDYCDAEFSASAEL